MSVLLDAGPVLNFLAVRQENVLVQLARANNLKLATAEQVASEVRGMTQSRRFRNTAAARVWSGLVSSGRIAILSDDLIHLPLAEAVARISGLPATERVRTSKSLGEIMVLAHASALAQSGVNVSVLIDDQDGRARAAGERDWLVASTSPGRLTVWSTRQVLREAAAHHGWILRGKTSEQVYQGMRAFDDGLPR